MSPNDISTTVVEKVARSKGVDHTELPALSEVIDPDALDALFSGPVSGNGSRSQLPVVEFTYADLKVVVRSADDIEVSDPSTAGGASDP